MSTFLELLLAEPDKVDSAERLALFQAFGKEHYADAAFLNLLKNSLASLLQNGVPEYNGWQIIDFTAVNGGSVHAWLNTQLEPIVLQSQALGMVLFKGTIGTRKVIYQFIGAAGTYGATATLATADDFILVYSDLQADIKVFRLAEGQSAATNIIKKFNLNTGWATFGAELPVSIDGLRAPVYLRVRESIDGTVNIYNYLWKGAAGSWGHGGAEMTDSMLELMGTKAESVQDIISDPNTVTVNLGELTSEDWITPLNSAARDFSNTANVYYVVYILAGVTYTWRFVGTPGVYGGSGNPAFTESMFASGPSGETPAYTVPTLKQVTDGPGHGYSNYPFVVESLNGAGDQISKMVIGSNSISNQVEGGNWGVIAWALQLLDGVTYTIPAKEADDTFAMLTDVVDMATQLIDGAGSDYNTFYKIQQKLNAITAIIGDSAPDADNIVNTVSELLEVFSTYPEGVNIITLIAGKVNTSDIVNNLNQAVAGKVLDAMQGKVLNDALAALTTTVNAKLTGTQATDAETQATSTPTAGKFIDTLRLYNWSLSTVFGDRVRAIALTGLSVATVAVVSATDSILSAIGKLQAQISNKAVAADYAGSPTDVAKLPTIKSLVDWKNLTTFWKSTAFAGTGSRMVQVDSTGQMSTPNEVLAVDRRTQDNDIITPATGATYNSGNNYTAVITPLNSKTFYEGQYFFSGNYKYEAESNNTVRRQPLG
ncbi:hypothetical protein ACLI1A_10245 [Flavobacterium sp. RHBU_3]|uniref:hypothetical protein n=1 Tax=Flavobacterium sp. RHBU_3 TaxID=3391184 RepID=UPI0039852547